MTRSIGWIVCLTVLLTTGFSQAEVKQLTPGGFTVEQDVILAATPSAVYDTVTGDISGWWDHSFSKTPKKLYIEPKPGGGFYESFNDSGDGALHATVIYAERGKKLTFTGPLGLSGKAVDIVTSYELSPDPAGTRLHLTVNATGQTSEDVAKIVDSVWHHFLIERLQPYIKSGAYLRRKP